MQGYQTNRWINPKCFSSFYMLVLKVGSFGKSMHREETRRKKKIMVEIVKVFVVFLLENKFFIVFLFLLSLHSEMFRMEIELSLVV